MEYDQRLELEEGYHALLFRWRWPLGEPKSRVRFDERTVSLAVSKPCAGGCGMNVRRLDTVRMEPLCVMCRQKGNV